MKKNKIWLILILILVVLQIIPSERPVVIDDNPDDLLLNNNVPKDVERMLRTACYDCHSNETKYPWYANVAPVSFLVNRDIRVGREELNFSDWESFSKVERAKYLDGIFEAVEAEEMPMPIYPPLHPEAKLSTEDRKLIMSWAENFAESMFE